MSQVAKKNATMGVTLGILSLFMISYGISYIQVIIAGLAAEFPDIPESTLSYIISVAPLGGVFSGLAAGYLTSKRIVGYKPLAIFGTLCFLIGGAIPAFIHNFYVILVCRFVLGIGMGMMSVLANPLVNAYYEGDAKTKMLSLGAGFAQFGAMCMQLFAGVLADFNIWYAFLADALSILSVLGAIFLVKEPPADSLPAEDEQQKGTFKELNGRIWYCAALYGVITLFLCPFLFNVSFFALRVTDSFAVISTVQLAYTIGMIVGGFAYAIAFKLFKRRLLSVGALLLAGGIMLVCNGTNLPMMYAGEFIAGLGYAQFMPGLFQVAGVSVKPHIVGFATSIIMTMMQISSFLASPFCNIVQAITGDGVMMPVYVGVAGIIIIAVIVFAASPYPKNILELIQGEEQ